jgi:hypothetical protein
MPKDRRIASDQTGVTVGRAAAAGVNPPDRTEVPAMAVTAVAPASSERRVGAAAAAVRAESARVVGAGAAVVEAVVARLRSVVVGVVMHLP